MDSFIMAMLCETVSLAVMPGSAERASPVLSGIEASSVPKTVVFP
ncbi:MAG: hypothetical protein A4E69_00229 [Syntrophus sp. PtaB.Bin138]|nr:MAG: hypothetical protein A4E69_00229 [Syntrophus sp. PtaB.Bin138]